MLFKIGITIASAGWMVLLLSVMATFIMDVRLIIFIGLGGPAYLLSACAAERFLRLVEAEFAREPAEAPAHDRLGLTKPRHETKGFRSWCKSRACGSPIRASCSS